MTRGDVAAVSGIIIFVVAVLYGLFSLISDMEARSVAATAQDHQRARERCAALCVARDAEWDTWVWQKLGFGAWERRCFCDDGHMQVIP